MALLHRRSTSKRASQKMWENNAAMPDDASANDNVSSARPEPAAFVPTPFDEVIDISDLVAERRRLQRNLWAMRIITIVLLIAAIAVACFPLALQFESDRNLAATTATTAKEVAGWPYPQAEDKLTAAPRHTTRSSLNPASLSWVKPSIRSPPLKEDPKPAARIPPQRKTRNTSHCLIPATA